MANVLTLFIILPLLAALFSLPLRRGRDWFFTATAASLLALALYCYQIRPINNLIVFKFNGISFLVLDGLSHFFLLGLALAALIYAFYSFGDSKAKPFALYLLAALSGVILAGEMISLLLFSLIMLFGVGHFCQKEGKQIGLGEKASLALAGLFLAVGLISIMFFSGSTLLPMAIGNYPLVVKVLVIAGFALIAGVVPFHRWLVNAGSPLIYAMVNSVGLYGLLRFSYNIFGLDSRILLLMTALGLLSLLYAGLIALARKNIAYNNIAQTGLALTAAGLATPLGIMAAIFHILNLIMIKPLLVYADEAADKTKGVVVFAALLAGWLANAAIPPFNGFWSTHYLVLATVQKGNWPIAALLIAGALLILVFSIKTLKEKCFSGESGEGAKVSWPQGTALMVSVLLCFLVGIFSSNVIMQVVNPAVIALANGTGYAKMVLGGLQ
ncbi:MAG: proton-conducting transporter membrane subunit [Candidatus Margulisbacteria bacterium]|nr:proton-conducting transporter membrane subunit [Candidatus Margulisiibacteriota bacterium]